MDLRKDYQFTTVTLSERNLQDLAAQQCAGVSPLLQRMTDQGHLTVTVQPDDVHYERRVAGPGSGLVDRPKPVSDTNVINLCREDLEQEVLDLRARLIALIDLESS